MTQTTPPTAPGNDVILVTNMQTLYQIGMAHIGSKHEVQYVDYDNGQWSVPCLLTKERLNRLRNDYSVKAVRLTELVESEVDDDF